MTSNIDKSPIHREGKEKLKETILYTKQVLRIITNERDRFYADCTEYQIDKYNKTIKEYQNRCDKLIQERRVNMIETLSQKNPL